jgi:hypothetical protein
VKGRRGKATLWESVRSAAMPRSIVHVSVRLTQETGCTMRLLRFGRYVWVLWGVGLPCRELRVIDERGFRAWAELPAVGGPDRGPPHRKRAAESTSRAAESYVRCASEEVALTQATAPPWPSVEECSAQRHDGFCISSRSGSLDFDDDVPVPLRLQSSATGAAGGLGPPSPSPREFGLHSLFCVVDTADVAADGMSRATQIWALDRQSEGRKPARVVVARTRRLVWAGAATATSVALR